MFNYNLAYLNKIDGKVFKLFDAKQKLNNSSSYGVIMFDVLHYKELNSNNDFLKKTYFLSYTKNSITFLDCNTNEIVNCKCFLTNENNDITVYFEPWHTNAQTIVNITYCNNLSLFNFNILGKCDIEKNTINNIIYSGANDDIVEDYDITFENSWANYNNYGSERSKINYKNNVVNINFKIKSGDTTNGTKICSIDSKYTPTRDIYAPCFIWDGVKVELQGFACINKNGEIMINGVNTNTLLCIEFNYLK